MEYIIGTKTHIGNVRDKNEDAIYYDKDCNIVIVADGIGGYEGGEVASNIVVENANYYFSSIKDSGDDYSKHLSNFLMHTNYKIIEKQMQEFKYCRMGTTATILNINDSFVHYAHIGDCRILHISDGECNQITNDHNEAGEIIKLGLADQNDLNLQNKTKLTRFLGQGEEIEIDKGKFKIKENDFVVVATDGLFGKISSKEITSNIINSTNILNEFNMNKITNRLLNFTLKSDGSDNITFALIYFKN